MGKKPKPILTPLDLARGMISFDPRNGKFHWKIHITNARKKPGDIAGYLSSNKEYWRINLMGQEIRAHRLAWYLHYGEDPGADLLVDHINGDSLDNRIDNLRLVTESENSKNRKKGNNNTTGFKGVYQNKDGSISARIDVNGKNKYLGSFKTVELAAKAYKEASIKYHGEFRRVEDLALSNAV